MQAALERNRLREAIRAARMVLPMFESGFGIEKAKRILEEGGLGP